MGASMGGDEITSPLNQATREVTLLILDTGSPDWVLEKYGENTRLFQDLLTRSVAEHLQVEAGGENKEHGVVVDVKTFPIAVEPIVYPNEEELSDADGVLVPGSDSSAYDDEPWIHRLADFVKCVAKNYTNLKLFGICFGHQIIAHALGGKVERNPSGYEGGLQGVELSVAGHRSLGGLVQSESFTIWESHSDHVVHVPEGWASLGGNSSTPCQGLVFPSTAPDLPSVRALTFQGHPEFTPHLVLDILRRRVEQESRLADAQLGPCRDGVFMPTSCAKLGLAIVKILEASTQARQAR